MWSGRLSRWIQEDEFIRETSETNANEYSNNANGNEREDGTDTVEQPRNDDAPPESQYSGESGHNDDNETFNPVMFLHV